MRKLTEDNKELAANLRRELTQQFQPKSAAKPAATSKSRKQGSELGSGRGSEERHSSVPAGGRGTKRGKDNDVEKVGPIISLPSVQVSDTSQDATHDSSEDGGCSIPQSEYPEDGISGISVYSNFISETIHLLLDSSIHGSIMPPGRRLPTKLGGRRFAQGTIKSDKGKSLKRTARRSQQDEGGKYLETVDHILAVSPPPDPPEYISKATERKGLFWAPLISGTTQDEKDAMDQEQAAAGKFSFPERYHPKYVETRQNDPGNLNRQLFYQCQNPGAKLAIAGTPYNPINIDPPGSGTPFDALKHPDLLIAKLNRLPGDLDNTLHGWNVKSLKRIPLHLISRIAPEALAALPEAFVSTLPAKLIAQISDSNVHPELRATKGRYQSTRNDAAMTEGQLSIRDLPATKMSGSFATNSTAREPMKAVLAPRHPQPVRGRKRGKVAHACNRCRIKKFKCDAIRPACLSCHNAGIECSFETDEASEPPEEPEEHMATLQPPGGMDTEDRAIANFLRQNDVSAGVIDPESPSDNSDAEADHAALDAVHRLTWTPFLGIDIHMLRRFAPNSKIDHLDLLETTDIPQSLRSKPVFNPHIFGLNKPTRLHYPKVYDQNVADSTRVWERQQEENFHTRPSVRIVVPDHLKNLLVDDWENVTKSLLVVPLPSKAPVNFIIDTYFDEEKGKRRLGSDEADVLEEFVAGMKVYFDKACGKTLLYKFERPQWAEVRTSDQRALVARSC